jgi:hypothetical protein
MQGFGSGGGGDSDKVDLAQVVHTPKHVLRLVEDIWHAIQL